MAGGTAILRGLARAVPAWSLRALGRPVAVHFHGVERQIDDPHIQLNHHAQDAFYKIAKTLKSDFDVLPLQALGDALQHPERHARSVFLMSDDGYRNLLTGAADILDSVGLPWTLFVSTHHIDTGEFNPFTLARLFLYFAPPGRYDIPYLGPIVLGDAASREKTARRAIHKLRALDAQRGREAVDAMTAAMPSDKLIGLKARFASERFLNWPQVAELAKRGVTIGAHAHYHWPMHANRSLKDLTQEARASKDRIENQIGACSAFAYPFGNTGDVSREAWQAVRDAGFAHGFTTLAGTLDGGANPFLLPRYALQSEENSLGALAPMLRAGNVRLSHWQRRLA